MALRSVTKNELNRALHEDVLSRSGTILDYLVDEVSIQPCLDELALEGWVIEAWSSKAIYLERELKDPDVRDWWRIPPGDPDEGVVHLIRTFTVLITRTPEHQAYIEQKYNHPAGENTYNRTITNYTTIFMAGKIASTDDTFDTSTDIVELAGEIVRRANIQGPRP